MKPGVWIFIAALAGLVVLGILVSQRFEGTPPRLLSSEEIVLGPVGATLTIEVEDADSGPRSLHVRLLDQSGSRTLAQEDYPGGLLAGGDSGGRRQRFELDLDPKALRVPDGRATLVISARDWSWRDGFAGNRTELSIPVVVDTRPPRIELLSGLTYVYRGGSAAAVYRVSEAAERDGVLVDEVFFPGFPHPGGEENLRVALFAIPVEASEQPSVRVLASDQAGNETTARFPARVQKRAFQQSEIEIDQAFVEGVAAPLAREAGLPTEAPAQTFQGVNETLRARNEETIREHIGRAPVAERLWSGAFRQLPGSAVMSRFAELRNYSLDGEPVSTARHYGFDLASTARAPIAAAAAGRVVFAGDLGIYGHCVILDHGLGLSSLYAHLSRIDVEPGEDVAQGAILGTSGATGLAGGDHLHFALLLGETYVNPLEWWDPKWVRSHIEVRLKPPRR
ncbi:MAG: M23 family metallopeptidase [Myxococcota bacterium]|nr:M23 family metallopeptidase [Myxococcota bacterium]